MNENSDFLLDMRGISKEFPGVKALDNVNFQLKEGEVHSLLGENGAGKSTLIKVLGGIYSEDSGEIYINGERVQLNSVEDSKNNGISVIHQELVLVPHMSVAENIFLGREPMRGLSVDFGKMNRETNELLKTFDLNIKATDTLGELSIANQQMVEIVKAISVDAKILVMDEPTSSISDTEVENLFTIINQLKANGVGIIYVSHKMSEIEEICDRVTVLRDGQYIDTVEVKDTSREKLVSLMVGRELDNHYTREYHGSNQRLFEVQNLSDDTLLKDISFHINEGEIIGFAGLIGAGRSELMETIFGLREFNQGKILMNGEDILVANPEEAMNHGIALVPENRKESGLFLDQDVKFNMTITVLEEFISPLKVDSKIERSIVGEYIKSLNVKTPSMDYPIVNLSGGNQQKAILGKWLATSPKLLILDEPTRGIDVGAKSEIYDIMNKLTNNGVSIIMVSSELPEIINISDRVYVMSDGEITGELARGEMTQDSIMNLATKNL